MTSAFDKRKEGFEAKWAHDEELRFKVFARRNKLLGLWAAGELGLAGTAAEEYARAVIAADLKEAGEEDVFVKIRTDFDAKGIALSDHIIRRQMSDLLETAHTQLESEAKK